MLAAVATESTGFRWRFEHEPIGSELFYYLFDSVLLHSSNICELLVMYLSFFCRDPVQQLQPERQ